MRKVISAESAGESLSVHFLAESKCFIHRIAKSTRSSTWLIGIAVLFLVGVAVWSTARRADRLLRIELLQEGRMVANAVDLRLVAALSGSEADLTSPHYLQLKEQLAVIRNANPRNRFLYLMGRKPNGAIFFFVDSEPASSKDYSPPGQIYEEATEPVRRAFATRCEMVAGPATDRWGTWVSALIPLFDPPTHRLLAVFGMDINASAWKWTVINRAALPAALASLALLLGIFLIVIRCASLDVRSSEERFRTLVEAAPEAIFVLSGGRFVYLNAATAKLFGASRAEDLLHKDFLERTVPESHEAIVGRIRMQHEMEKPISLIEQEYLRVDGSRVSVESAAVPIRFHGRDAHMVFVRDITERKRAEDEIQMLKEGLEQRVCARTAELEAANKDLESFSYSVSHDLRSPLRSIGGFSQIVLEEFGDLLGEVGRGHMNRIRAAAEKMSTLIDAMLTLSRLSRRDIRREPVNLSQLAEEIATNLRQHEPARHVDVFIVQGLRAECDPHLMRILLRILFENAWKFTRKQSSARVEFGYLNGKGRMIYFVKDNGAGFNMAYANKLFGSFQRLHKDEEYEGMGIGLAIAQRVIRRHGGKIWAEGEQEKGAAFYFTLEPLTKRVTPTNSFARGSL